MGSERGMMEDRWYREGNAARFCSGGGRRAWVFPSGDGHLIVIMPIEFTATEREAEFERLLLQFWCRHYGQPEARQRMREFVHGHEADSVAD